MYIPSLLTWKTQLVKWVNRDRIPHLSTGNAERFPFCCFERFGLFFLEHLDGRSRQRRSRQQRHELPACRTAPQRRDASRTSEETCAVPPGRGHCFTWPRTAHGHRWKERGSWDCSRELGRLVRPVVTLTIALIFGMSWVTRTLPQQEHYMTVCKHAG